MTSEYAKANQEFTAAIKEFNEIKRKYRSMEISDSQYLGALATYKQAEAIYDEAYSKEAALNQEPA